MDSIVPWLRLAGALQLLVVAASLRVIRIVHFGDQLATVSRFVREVSWVLYGWTLVTVLGFAGADLVFPQAIAGAHPLGTALAAALALLWAARLVVQLAVYDPALRREHRAADVLFAAIFAGLALVHGWAAIAQPLAGGGA